MNTRSRSLSAASAPPAKKRRGLPDEETSSLEPITQIEEWTPPRESQQVTITVTPSPNVVVAAASTVNEEVSVSSDSDVLVRQLTYDAESSEHDDDDDSEQDDEKDDFEIAAAAVTPIHAAATTIPTTTLPRQLQVRRNDPVLDPHGHLFPRHSAKVHMCLGGLLWLLLDASSAAVGANQQRTKCPGMCVLKFRNCEAFVWNAAKPK